MKKLLALILCVMMFVAVIPTAAFAIDIPTGNVPTVTPSSSAYIPKWGTKGWAKDAVDAASDNIQALYQTLAADKGVFATVNAIDGVVTGLSKEIWKDFDGTWLHKDSDGKVYGFDAEAAEKATNKFLRTVIGNEIMNYMNSHTSSFATHTTVVDADGKTVLYTYDKIDPAKYMETFATAASKALSSEKAVANIQALVLSFAAAQAYDDFLDDRDDLRDDIIQWNDGKGASVWATYFGQNVAGSPWTPYSLIQPASDVVDNANTGKFFPYLDTSDYSDVYYGVFDSQGAVRAIS